MAHIKKLQNRFYQVRAGLSAVALIMLIGGSSVVPRLAQAVSCSSSNDCQQKIDGLNGQNTQAKQSVGSLQIQAGSYQDAINKFQAQIDSLQQQITANQGQQAALQQQITDAQTKITAQKTYLGQDITAMYTDGQLTTIEELATSKNLSDYVDKEEYRIVAQNKINATIQQINALQAALKQQKVQLDQLVVSQKQQNEQLASTQAQQRDLLNYNESQQVSYNQQITANKGAITELYARQASIIEASFVGSNSGSAGSGGTSSSGGGSSSGGLHYGGTGNYPYSDAVCLNSDGDCGAYSYSPYNWGYPPNSPYDPAGWQYRNCTSYAFWRLAQTTGVTLGWGSFPTVYNSGGRIGQSLPDFRRLGYTVDHDPNGTAVLAVNTAGSFGHIMYVESVSNGQANVSQYNAASDGRYSTGTLANASNIWFVHVR